LQVPISTSKPPLRFRLSLSLWRSVWFRYLALWSVRHPKRSIVLAVALFAAALLAIFYRPLAGAIWWPPYVEFSSKAWHLWLPLPTWGGLSKTAAGLFLVWIFAWAFNARKRIFVASFEDYSGDSSLKDFVAGLPPLLLNELSRIRQIHEDARESGAYSSGSGAVSPSISVQNVGETLASAVTKDSKVKLGFLEIPIGAAFGVFGKLMQGPKLAGSLHKQEGVVTLIARMEGGRLNNADWRVNSTDLGPRDPADGAPVLTQLVEQLAYRIFTDQVPTGSKRWEAVYAFSQGLKHHRIAKLTEMDRPWNLRQAEARFIEAVAKDNKFGACYYNLGVVYGDLSEPESAKEAYIEAIKQEPGFAPSYYAMGFQRLNAAQKMADPELFADCIRFCDQAIALNPNLARAWDAKGLAYRRMKEAALGRPLRAGEDSEAFRPSAKARSTAAAIAWRSLCRSVAAPGETSESAKSTAVQCLRGHAVGTAMLGKHRRGAALFGQALYLSPADADLHFEFGKTLLDKRRYRSAIDQFTGAIRINPKPLYWAWLARAQVEVQPGIKDVKESLRRALVDSWTDDSPDPQVQEMIGETFSRLAIRAYGTNAPGDSAPINVPPKNQNAKNTLEELKTFRKNVDEALKVAAELKLKETPQEDVNAYLSRIEKILPGHDSKGWDFTSVIEALQNRQADKEVKSLVKSAAEVLVRDKGLNGTLALGYLSRKEPRTALPLAERAVILSPLGPWQRSCLGQVYAQLGDYERAEAEWKICLDRGPRDLETLSNVATTYWSRGVYRLEPDRRKEMFERVIENSNRVLRIADNLDLSRDKNERDKQIDVRGETHFRLGIFQKELLRYDDAVSELMKARGLGYKPLESSLWLGDTYLEAQAYDKAEDALREGFKSLNGLKAKARREKKPLIHSAQAPGEEMSVNEFLARHLFIRALACIGSGVNLDRARRMGQVGESLTAQVGASSQKELKASYYLVRGLLALKLGQIDLAIAELEKSISHYLYLGKGCHLSLAEAYLAQAQSGTGVWRKSIAKARESLQSACADDVRGRCANDLAVIKARIDAA
jgi:tetratricopeptide (TPR) repeat protein